MIRMRCCARGNRADKIARLDRINRSATHTSLTIFRQTAWTHPQILQHIPAPPMLQGTISSAREMPVLIPSSSARINIS